jgi:chromosome segregation ATPase
MQSIYLPNINKLILENFSLYPTNPVVIDFSKSISCIMGANGIGKSTLLNCINFSITGKINPPDKKLKSMDELQSDNNYHEKYFDGRISATDKDFAASIVTFTINDQIITVKRSFFPNKILEYFLNGEKHNCDNFESDIVNFSKLSNYAQFVFLQLKVLTFDENRDCLFWNPSILTPTIFLCLGKNVENADKADELARELQKLSSRIRNVQWEITKQNNRLSTLIEEKNSITKSEQHSEEEAYAKNEYEFIEKELERLETEKDQLIAEQQLVYAKTSELSIEKLKLTNEYQKIYSSLYTQKTNLNRNPLILEITNNGCPICKSVHDSLPTCVETDISKNICPLCGESIEDYNCATDEIMDALQKKDEQLKNTSDKLSDLAKRNLSISQKINEINNVIIDLSVKKENIEKQKFKFLSKISLDDSWDKRFLAIKP